MNYPEPYSGGELAIFFLAHRWKAYLRHQLAPFLGGRVLEVGAGMGGTTAALAALPHQSWLCLEPDADLAAALGRGIAAGALPRVELRRGTLAALEAGRVFDCILYIDVLEHIADDRGELARAAGHLAPGGHLIVLSPALPLLYSEFDRAIGHHRRYRRGCLRRAAPPGLEPVRLRYLDSAGMAASLANRLLLRRGLPNQRQIAVWDRLLVPLSRLLDPLLGYRLGRSLLAVWRRSA